MMPVKCSLRAGRTVNGSITRAKNSTFHADGRFALQAALFLLAGTACCNGQDPAADRATPYFNARSQQTEYVGPRDAPLLNEDLAEIRIGYFGPADPQDPVFGPLWQAAQRAIDDANRQGGFQGKPFRLLPAWSKDPWGTGVKQLTRLVYHDHVWAIVGGVDGPSTHLAEQVVAKARLPLVSPVSTDKTVNLANVPWMFSLAPGDHLVAAALAPEIVRRAGQQTLVLVTANDHDSYLLTRELRKELDKSHVVPQHQFEYKPNLMDIDALVRQCLDTQPDFVIVLAGARSSAQLVRTLRKRGCEATIFGGPTCGRDYFVTEVADLKGDIVFPLVCDAPDPHRYTDSSDATDLSGLAATDQPPLEDYDFAEVLTYDAVQLVVAAIRQAGLSRADIGHALRDLSPLSGLSGPIIWDGLGGNTRRPTLAVISQGRVVRLRKQ